MEVAEVYVRWSGLSKAYFFGSIIWEVLLCVGEDNETLLVAILRNQRDHILSQKQFTIQGIILLDLVLIQSGGLVVPFQYW